MIDINKKYKTRCGYPVRVYCTDAGGPYPVHAAYYDNGWFVSSYTEFGGAEDGGHGSIDLIEVNPYAHIKIDDRVIVRDNHGYIEKVNRHFAGVSNDGKPLVWSDGQTSYTSIKGAKTEWDNCILFEESTNG